MPNVIRVALPGYNAETDTNPDHFIFSSDYNTLKYNISNCVNITIIGNDTEQITETTIAHNLNYVPFFVVYVKIPDLNLGYAITPYYANRPTDSPTVFREAEAFIDDTNLYVRFRNKSANTYTATFCYKIYKNNLGV